MAKQASKPASLRESWRPDPANDKRELRRRIALRLAFASTLCLLAGLFGYLLFTPLFHPTTRLFFLTAGSYASLGEEPIPFFQEDALRFLSSDGSFQPDDARREFFLLESPDTFRQALTRIAESVTDRKSVV